MDKSELLLRMVENPEQYSDEQIQELLTDDECRELYEAMRLSADAFELEDAKAKIAAGLREEEWQKFEASLSINPESESQEITSSSFPTGKVKSGLFFKIAAMFIGLLVLSGIAYAAINMLNHTPDRSQKGDESSYIQAKDTVVKSSAPLLLEEREATHIVFDNIPLEKMLSQIAAYYNKEVAFQNADARQLRFYFEWKQEETLDVVLHRLNLFESINIEVKDNKIVVQ